MRLIIYYFEYTGCSISLGTANISLIYETFSKIVFNVDVHTFPEILKFMKNRKYVKMRVCTFN